MTTKNTRIPEEAIITLLADKHGLKYGHDNNPKRTGSLSADRFNKYLDGETLEKNMQNGVIVSDVRYDVAHGIIALTPDPGIPLAKRKKTVVQENVE